MDNPEKLATLGTQAVFKLYSCTRKENKNTNHISFMYKDGSVIVPCTDGTAVVVIV
jgi:hypothetical protein